jgi:hypothetical protein
MLIDAFAPNPDAVEAHSITIAAPPGAVYRALWTADFGSRAIKLLLGLRALPGFVVRGFRSLPQNRNITLDTLLISGFGILAEEPGREIVLGVIGRFWRPASNLSPFNRAAFDRPVLPGLAHAVWNFHVAPGASSGTILSTETRVVCGDQTSRRKFLVYWSIVRPFSGLIRRIMLKAIMREATRGS